MNLGSTELLIVVVIVVVVFGSSWLPKAARNLGRAKVEVDKAQKQLNDTKAQVIEATGIEKADAALRKANQALNTSPQNLMKNAAKSAIMPTAAAADADDAKTAEAAPDKSGAAEPATHEADQADGGASEAAADVGESETVNVDFNDD